MPNTESKCARGRRLAPILALLLAATGCATAGAGWQTENPMDPASLEGDEIQLLVRNLNFNQVTVYTARGGPVRRLGTVPGKGEATFRMNWHLPHLQLRVKELAGDEYLTETLPVSPGDFLELILPVR